MINCLQLLGKENIVFDVSGDDKRVIGTYMISDEVADEAPNCPVWKLEGKEMYVFNDGSNEGWRIGDKDSLTDGSFFFKSKKWVYCCLSKLKIEFWYIFGIMKIMVVRVVKFSKGGYKIGNIFA